MNEELILKLNQLAKRQNTDIIFKNLGNARIKLSKNIDNNFLEIVRIITEKKIYDKTN